MSAGAERGAAAVARAAGRRDASVLAQAKINLFLRVLAREASGYHQLETLFQRLELGDEVRVRVGVRGRALDCAGAAAPDGLGPVDQNLAWRAAVTYAEATGWPDGFAIEIDKQIPVGGGLGGGSADAGAVLRCLNALAPRPLSTAELLAVGAPLGADVPFLTAEVPLALAWGRGERLLALPALPERRAYLAVFDEGVPTADAYAALAEHRGADARPRAILWTPERFARWDDVALVATNDFEDVVLPLREDVAGIRAMFGDVVRRIDALHDAADTPDAPGGTAPGGAAPGGAGPTGVPPEAAQDATPEPGDRVPIALMSGSGATVFLLAPLAGVGLEFEVVTPDGAAESPGLAVVETRTATRVAAVAVGG